jgi:predicted ATP-binding protein involved in virulence
MYLERIELRNFRGITRLQVDFDRRLTVIVGANGVGKTSILDAVAIGLSQYIARLSKTAMSARRITDDDVKIDSTGTRIQILAEDGSQKYRWTMVKQDQREKLLRPVSSDYRGVSDLVKRIAERAEGSSTFLAGEAPVIFYNQRRAIIEIPQRKRGKISHEVADAFAESLDVGRIDFRKLTYWFQERETEELRKQRRRKSYLDPQLEAVRKAISSATGLKDPYYRIEAPRGLTFTKGRTELHANQLSTGERIYMALAGDLARRLAIINPNMKNPLLGKGIVLIDEVELHLHPAWQRRIISWLTNTFANVQFIITTHSPQVLGEVHSDVIRVLNVRRNEVRLDYIRASLGRDSNYLLAAAFGADERSPVAKGRIDRIDKALADGRLEDVAEEIRQLRDEVEGADPQIDIAEARLARRTRAASE